MGNRPFSRGREETVSESGDSECEIEHGFVEARQTILLGSPTREMATDRGAETVVSHGVVVGRETAVDCEVTRAEIETSFERAVLGSGDTSGNCEISGAGPGLGLHHEDSGAGLGETMADHCGESMDLIFGHQNSETSCSEDTMVDTDVQPPLSKRAKLERETQSSQESVAEMEVYEGPVVDRELPVAACVKAFRRHYSDLATAIQNPEVVAMKLFSQEVISDTVLEEVCTPTLTPIQRKTRLLSAVRNQIAVDPKVFSSLLQVLKTETYLMNMALRLEQTCQTHKNELSIMNLQEPPQPAVVPPLDQSQPSNAMATSCFLFTLECKNEPSIMKPQTLPQPVALLDQSQPPMANAMASYASYLKSVYLRQKIPTYGKLPHSPSKKYTNLASVKKEPVSKEQADAFTRATIHGGIDDVAQKKVPITMEEIAVVKNGVWPKCILVEGVPGIGKSTFAWKMCRKWGKGKILRDYKLVVLLSLREKKVREATCVSDLFPMCNRRVHEQVVKEVEDNEGRGVLLLFEGYDELAETLRMQDSLFLDLICGKELLHATVLITSRPSASGFLYEECYLSQRIEILGFTSENIQSYLESTYGSNPSLLSGIQKYLQCYPHIRTMMYVPLNAAIVAEVYRTSKKDQSLVPGTMTQLYECLVRSLLRRHLRDHSVDGKQKWKICKFDDLPPDVYTQLCEVGKIAYEGIVNNRQVIFDDLSEDFETLGLMQCVPELYMDKGAAVSHSFLHLTIQEFMAAFHLFRNPVEGHVPSQGMVMRFLAGLNGLEGTTFGSSELELDRDHLHLMFEAQRVADVLTAGEVRVSCEHGDWSRFDYFVLGYCISHSNSSWEVALSPKFEGFELEELVHGALEKPGQSHGGISVLTIPEPLLFLGQSVSTYDVQHLLKLPKCMLISSLKTLNVAWERISPEGMDLSTLLQQTTELKKLTIMGGWKAPKKWKSLASDLKINRTLTRLQVEGISPEGATHLAGALHKNTTLRELVMSSVICDLGVAGATALAKALTVNASLQKLDIARCGIDSESAGQLINVFRENTTLQEMNMSKNPIGDTGATALAEVLAINTSLRKLDILECHFDFEGGCQLARALHMNNTLQILIMPNNCIRATGATALAEALTVNTSLRKLDISASRIGSEGVCRLASALCTNNTLQILIISDNSIGATGPTALAKALTVNKSLVKLKISASCIRSEGVRQLASALQANNTLQALYLSGNRIGTTGATALAEALKVNKSLRKLKISASRIRSEGTRQLASALQANNTLQALYMSGNRIGATGATALAEALNVNTSLMKLKISASLINSEGARQLASALRINNTLQTLYMSGNHIEATGATALAEALTINISLKKLNISDLSVGEQGTRNVLHLLAQNTMILETIWLPICYRHVITSTPVGDTTRIVWSHKH